MRSLRTLPYALCLLAALGAASFHLLTQPVQAQTPQASPPERKELPSKPADAAPQQQSPAFRPANIDRIGILMLVRTSLLALDQANKTGNYTVLRDIGSPGFQFSNTAARLGEIFVSGRRDNLDLSGVAVVEPTLSTAPQLDANGMMRLTGTFPSVSTQVRFDLIFTPINGQWKLFGMSVSLDKAGPSAPSPSSVSAPPSSTPNALQR